jgi:putative ribosome biogenesis GTPase RsgA
MSAKSVFMMGFLSIIAATGLFGAANGFADTGHTTRNSEGVTTNTAVEAEALEATEDKPVVADDVQIPETSASRDQVVDSEENVNRLTPPQTTEGKTNGKHLRRFMPRTGLY